MLLSALILTACDPRAGRTCADGLEGEAPVTLGQATLGHFGALEPSTTLAVHAGSQGGFHSDLLVLVEGAGADVDPEAGVLVEVETGAPPACDRSPAPPRAHRAPW